MNPIYFDSASTTCVDEQILNTYSKLLKDNYYNPDALYDPATKLFKYQETSRKETAKILNINPNELIFTSGASEANSLAIKGVCLKQNKKKHIITSIYEHSSSLECFKQLEQYFDFKVTYLNPINGIIKPNQVLEALDEDTILVSIMMVNNEIGAINPINEIKQIVKKNSHAYFHSDITQAIGKIDVDLKDIDLASFSCHKIHGLKSSGCLIKKQHVEILPLICGGSQEFSLRGGTSNAPLNALVAKTLRLALENKDKYNNYIKDLYNYFLDKLSDIESITINKCDNQIHNIISINTPLTSEVMTNSLNLKSIMVSSKSTCSIKQDKNSPSLKSIGVDDNYTIRISIDYINTKQEINYFIEAIKEIIKDYEFKLR